MIYFLSLTQFPTRKAYGVTLAGTYRAVIESEFEAQIVAPNSLHSQRFWTKLLLNLMRMLRRFYSGVPVLLSKVAFAVHRILFCQVIKAELSRNSLDVFWIRDLSLAQFLNHHFPDNRVILEIHQLQSDKNMRKLEELSDRIILGPISEAITRQLDNLTSRKFITQLPMGVSDYFFLSEASAGNTMIDYDIGYFGSYKNSGYAQGIESVLMQLIPRLKLEVNFKLLFAGIGPEGVKNLKQIALKEGVDNQILFIEYLDHELVPAEMRKCRTLLLPYPEGMFFESRFPIKALEYAAVKRPILCSRTKSHKNLFNDGEVWFYDVDNPSGILDAFDEVLLNESLTAHKVQVSFDLACKYTYADRVKKIKLDSSWFENTF
jgi:hypothetical protein